MGKASSSKKVARAAKAAGRPGAKKNYAWPMTIGAVVLVGVLLILFTVSSNDDSEPGAPGIGDHWHAAYGIYDCDKFIAPLTDTSDQDPGGIHTHGEGLMHIHPFLTRTSGSGANLFHFGQQVGMRVTDDSFKTPRLQRSNGDKCGTKTGHVELVTWKSGSDTKPKIRTKGLADYAPKNGTVWVLAFVADGTEVPLPDSVKNLVDPTAAEEGRQPASPGVSTPNTTAAEGTSTTATSAPGAPPSSTSTTPESSSSTSTP